MKNKILLHIPHSSLAKTREFESLTHNIDEEKVDEFNYAMTDLYTDKLFSSRLFSCVKEKYSRICCDMEKFASDKDEPMSKFGMGVIYTKTNKGESLIDCDEMYRQKVLEKYYLPYHRKLDETSIKKLQSGKNVIMVDCHSFSKEIVMDKQGDFPDICIGVNDFCSSEKLNEFVVEYFRGLGYSVEINYPYSGSIVPNIILNGGYEGFYSVMIEVNRKLYLNGRKKGEGFNRLKQQIKTLLFKLKRLNLDK